jgi:MFS family permease
MPIIVAPIAGVLSGRIGARPIVSVGLALMSVGLAWLASIAAPDAPYSAFVLPFIVSGVGMGMFFAPIANVVLSAVKPEEEGKASGANNAIREVGGVFGVAVLAAVFTAKGSYFTPDAYVAGLVPAVWIGAIVVAFAAVAALFIPSHVRGQVEVPDASVALAGASPEGVNAAG